MWPTAPSPPVRSHGRGGPCDCGRPHGDFFKYTYDEPVHLQSEMDGVRIISNSKCEFLQVRRSSRNALVSPCGNCAAL